jgi:phenylalanyl-tRNA synthetase alpha chain
MNEEIPQLPNYDESSLDAAFATLADEVRGETVSLADVEAFRLRWLGRKQGRLKLIGDAWLKSAPPEARKPLGIRFNQLKQQIEAALEDAATAPAARAAKPGIDITLPGMVRAPGIEHPLVKTMNEVVAVFHRLGYSTALGPQVESDFYNFEALNFPPNHPARDTQDTIVLADQQAKPSRDRLLMRTHTSPVQIRSMVAHAPPVRIVVPGNVYRNEAEDATHLARFQQVEGLCVDTNITFSDLKGTLDHAMKSLFGSGVNTRFFPSFFPFTEPSADMQISCIFCAGNGCRKCKHSGWIELLGCGMVDPAVFAAVSEERRKLNPDDDAYSPANVTGFAFGMGVERIAMILHGVANAGSFYSNDMRFLEQFA